MRIPKSYLELMKKWTIPGEEAFYPLPPSPIIYPPAGFLAWPFGDLGNGDTYGFYWPIGKEDEEPVVALMSHDCWGLNPIASSIEALARMGSCQRLNSLFDGRDSDYDEVDGAESQNIADRLALDDRSPFLLVANADVAMSHGDLGEAESHYLKAVEILPDTAEQLTTALSSCADANARRNRRFAGCSKPSSLPCAFEEQVFGHRPTSRTRPSNATIIGESAWCGCNRPDSNKLDSLLTILFFRLATD